MAAEQQPGGRGQTAGARERTGPSAASPVCGGSRPGGRSPRGLAVLGVGGWRLAVAAEQGAVQVGLCFAFLM